jgi:hypothetical protein
MAYLIGMDEAGYGPNLGPLVITAVAWEVPGDPRKVDLWSEFSGIVSSEPAADGEHLQIGDSKSVYTPSRGLGPLETGVLAALRLHNRPRESSFPGTLHEVCRRLHREFDGETHSPWVAEYDVPIPHSLNGNGEGPSAHHVVLGDAWRERCGERKVALRGICCDVVSPRRFNARTRAHDSKGRALSEISFEVLSSLWNEISPGDKERVLIIADKHGGRNRYHEFLPIVFGDRFIQCRQESMDLSSYAVGNAEVRFETRSERHLPVALASMICKYLRELAMVQFNRFWTSRVADLKPTAGYPNDAKRFRESIAALQQKLGIADDDLWRER